MIKAQIIADSIGKHGSRLTTYLLEYPRFIHSELMTHRQFSRNAASSRAIPVSKMIKRIRAECAKPIHWGKNQTGMQAACEVSDDVRKKCDELWIKSSEAAIYYASQFDDLGVHKQAANRILEPYCHMQTLVSATEYGNFFGLRCHKDADPNFQVLADKMLKLYIEHVPRKVNVGDWHLPFKGDVSVSSLKDIVRIVTARAARTSYFNFDGTVDHDKDYALHDALRDSGHWSPFEHCAQCSNGLEWSGNFRGWEQYRKTFPTEVRCPDLEWLYLERGLKELP